MRLIDRLNLETAASHAEVDEAMLHVAVTPASYRRYLSRTYGFVAALERSITTTPRIESYVDLRRFNKEELLRRDLIALGATAAQVNAIPQCAVPLFDFVEEALGWAFFVERSTLAHNALFRYFAGVIPGEIAFASSYLKCYFGSVGEMWRAFGDSLELVARDDNAGKVQVVVDGALAAFRCYRSWSQNQERDPAVSSSARPAHV